MCPGNHKPRAGSTASPSHHTKQEFGGGGSGKQRKTYTRARKWYVGTPPTSRSLQQQLKLPRESESVSQSVIQGQSTPMTYPPRTKTEYLTCEHDLEQSDKPVQYIGNVR
jgi:hypothetical protein